MHGVSANARPGHAVSSRPRNSAGKHGERDLSIFSTCRDDDDDYFTDRIYDRYVDDEDREIVRLGRPALRKSDVIADVLFTRVRVRNVKGPTRAFCSFTRNKLRSRTGTGCVRVALNVIPPSVTVFVLSRT